MSKLESKGGFMFCHFFSRNSKISHFGHLPLILKSPTNNTHHHPYSLLIFAIFSFNFSFRHALLFIFENVHWILKRALQTSSPTMSTILLWSYDFPWAWHHNTCFKNGNKSSHLDAPIMSP